MVYGNLDRSGDLWDYFDFDLEIEEAREPQKYSVTVRSPAGETRQEMRLPFAVQELENKLLTLENAILRSRATRRRILTSAERTVQDFGRSLFEALIVGEIHALYVSSLGEARRQYKGLRIKLRILPPELIMLPWEFLYDPSQDRYLSLSTNTPLVRYQNLLQPIEPLRVAPPLRVLGMAASPPGPDHIDVEYEKRLVDAAIRGLQENNVIELVWLEGQTWRDLQRALRRGPWHIFHFVGHGGFDPMTEEGSILLTDDAGQERLLRATGLAELLDDHYLRIVFLNSCEGARGGESDAFSSTAATLVRRGIPAVVAMQYEITDKAALEFSRALYEAIVDGLPVEAAVTEARTAVSIDGMLEWGTPVLYMRSADGHIFEIPQEQRAEEVREPIAERTGRREQVSNHPPVIPNQSQTPEVRIRVFLEEGHERFRRETINRDARLLQHGSWEVAVIFAGAVPSRRVPDEDFLDLLARTNPRYTGWPVWIDSRSFANIASLQPYVFEGGWEAFISGISGGLYTHIDFWRAEPAGRFYLYRAFQDDLSESNRAPEPMTVLDPLLMILRMAEAIAVPMEFAKAMQLQPENTTLHFAFRWSGLRDRELSAWAFPERDISLGYFCRQQEVSTTVTIPLETPTLAIAPYVGEATADLLAAFRGFALRSDVIEDLTSRLLERRL